MNNPSTIQQLRDMKFSAMANELELQLRDPTAYAQISFEDRFGLLVNAEWSRRQANKIKNRIDDAGLCFPSAVVEEIEYYEDRKLDRSEIIRFSTCAYIEEKHHIILKGAAGSGKTFLACALGNAACRKFKKVIYVRLCGLNRPTYLCLKDDAHTDLYTAFATGELRATHLPVLCSVPLSNTLYRKTGNFAASVFIPICAGAAPAWKFI